MVAWQNVVTQPLGFAAYALTVLFWVFRRVAKGKGNVLAARICLIAGFCALFGGLVLAYLQAIRSTSASSKSQTNSVQQSTSGAGSPAIQGVQGDVHVTVDQSHDLGQGAPVGASNSKQKPK